MVCPTQWPYYILYSVSCYSEFLHSLSPERTQPQPGFMYDIAVLHRSARNRWAAPLQAVGCITDPGFYMLHKNGLNTPEFECTYAAYCYE